MNHEKLGKAAYNLHMMKQVMDGKEAPPAWEQISEQEREHWRKRGLELAKGKR